MKQSRSWQVMLAQILIVTPVALALVAVHAIYAGDEPFHLATDWSHRHMVFSPPKTLMERFEFSMQARYVQQWVRRNAEEKGERDRDRWRWRHAEENPIHEDWSVYLGNVGTVGAGRYPAKFSFDPTVANCASATQPDFVAWNTSLAGSTTMTAASVTGTFSGIPVPPATITIANGASTLIMSATNGASGAGTYNRGGSASGAASSFAAAINGFGNGSSVGVGATSSGAVVTLTATAAGAAGNSITVASSTSPPSSMTWSFAHLVDGASGVPSIVAYDNLYSNCTGNVPSSYWAYNTGGTITNSVALSFNGKQVAFVQSVGGAANLVILKWAVSSGTVSAPVTLSSQATAAAYRACIAPCMYSIAFSGGRDDTNSAPYYDIDTDTIYVGDTPATRGTTNAALHKFTGVFNGNPAEVITAGAWPATLGVEIASSPVYNFSNNQVYIADTNTVGTPTGGFLYRVDGTAGTVITSTRLSRGVGFMDAPVVDPVNATVYLYSSDGGIVGCPGATNNAVYQMATNFAAGAGAVTSAQVSAASTCSTTIPLYAGDFDNAYLTGNAGHIYVCGNIGGNPTLYQVNITAAGALGTANTGPAVATAATTCSPVTEFYNANGAGAGVARDWIFLNVQASAVTAAPITCPAAAGCLMLFNVTSGAAITNATATTARTTVAGGASGVVVDNNLSTAGNSEVYFTPLAAGNCATTTSPGVGGCAIQATQSGLI